MFKGVPRCFRGRLRAYDLVLLSKVPKTRFLSGTIYNCNQGKSLKSKISKFITNFINQESQALKNSMNQRLDYEWEVQQSLESLSDDLKIQLQSSIDNINKLYLLLSYNPLTIDPQLYFYYLDRIDTVIDPEYRNLLYKRLIFHQMYEKLWQIFHDSYTSINDIEDFLDFSVRELQALNNMSFGLLEFLLSCQTDYFQPHFKNLILETICFKLHLNRDLIDKCISIHNSLQNFQSIDDLIQYKQINKLNHIYINQIYLKKYVLIMLEENISHSAIISKIMNEFGDITEFPGWLSLIGPKFSACSFLNTDLYKFGLDDGQEVEIDDRVRLNELDIIYMIRSQVCVNYDKIYDIYESSTKVSSLEKHIQNHLFSKLIHNGSKEVFQAKLVEKGPILDEELLIRGLGRLLNEDNFSEFEEIVLKLDTNVCGQIMKNVYRSAIENKLKVGKNLVSIFLQLIKISNKLQHRNFSIRTILRYVNNDIFTREELIKFYEQIFKQCQITSISILLEIMRSMIVRNDIFEAKIFNYNFDLILEQTMKKKMIKLRPLPVGIKPNNDFDELYKTASPRERAKFHNCLRGIGQMVSLLNAQDICKIITMINHHIYHGGDGDGDGDGGFAYTKSKYGRDYIYNNVIEEIMRFIERENYDNPKLAIFKMRDILGGIECFAIPVRGYIFKIMVKEDPSKAIKLLQFYQNNKPSLTNLIQYIILGIFQTNTLTKNEKILYFTDFLQELQLLGYRHKIRQSTGYELVKLLKSQSGIENKILTQSLQLITNLTKNHKSLKNVFKMHSLKNL